MYFIPTQVEEDRHPYVVSLFIGNRFGCGGTLISKDTVVTAA